MNPSALGADVDACFAHFTRRVADLALHSEANRNRIAVLGGTEFLVLLLGRATDDAVVEGSAVALSNLALSDEGRTRVQDAGGVEPLVKVLSSSVGDGAQAAAAGALRNLACSAAGRDKIAEHGGVEKLVAMLAASRAVGVQENAAAAIANLADDSPCRERVAQCGGLDLLATLCNTSQSDAVLACTAAALGNLADDDKHRVEIARVGALEPLVRLCASSINDSVLESAAAALANLAYNESNRKRIAQLTGIEPLVWLCAHSRNEAVLESASAALGNLAYYNDMNRIKVAETGGLAALVHLCETSESEAVLEAAAGALRHVVYNNDSNRIKLVKVGGLELLVRLCATSDNEAVLESATAMLRKAVANADIAHKLLDAGALPALSKLESEWTGAVQSYAASTLNLLEKHARRPWNPPSGRSAEPNVAYMLLPAAHPASMTPAVRAKMVVRKMEQQDGSNADSEGGDFNMQMDAVHTDLEALEAFIKSRSGARIQADRCIEAGDASMVVENAGPSKALKEFFSSDEIDLFVLAYAGHATSFGGWCFADTVISFEEILGMWQQARARTANTEARLLIVVDAPFAGRWVQALEKVPSAAAFASGIAVQAACGPDQPAWVSGEHGGAFTSWYVSEALHGHSPWSLPDPSAPPSAPPHADQVPCMACKFDVFSNRRALMSIGGEEHVPDMSLFGSPWFAR
mmetsp:Transcript_47487/g.113055  ORF Transcript_47487/g.113055 Transcript_47487/m.113055 type:complete len:694 (+) Transcript_47487:45-2126(+)